LTIFIDASAMISMMTGESDANELADQMEAEQSRLCSAISLWETIAGLCRSYTFSVPSARRVVQSFIALNEIKFVTVGEREFELASQAYAEFGKGRHPAALNLGDCFAYACAKSNRAKLLFKGDDFTKTDISAL
jgi:ribonuclease VapC